MRYFLIWLLILFISGSSQPTQKTTTSPQISTLSTAQMPLPAIQVDRDCKIFRSAQPSSEEFKNMAAYGLKSVLNLRNYHSDKKLLKNTPLIEYHLPVNAGKLSQQNIVDALIIIKNAPKPILIHCYHGVDRTGTIIAAYKIVFENSSVEEAINDLYAFGFHDFYYKNIPILLRSVDWAQIRIAVKPEVEKPQP